MSLREMENQISADVEDGIDTQKVRKISLNDMFDEYMSGKFELKQSSRELYFCVYNRYVRKSLGTQKISSIKYSHVKKFYLSLSYEVGLSMKTICLVYSVLHPVFNIAYRDGYIRTNPSNGVITELKKTLNWEKSNRRALTIEQQTAFVDFVASSKYSRTLHLFTVLLGTGCRIGEVIGLRWEDCDFQNNMININHNIAHYSKDGEYEYHISTPKTKSGCRIIPMLKDVRTALINEREEQMRTGFNQTVIDGYSGFIFTTRRGFIYSPQTINNLIKRICRDYNVQEMENAKTERREPILLPNFSAHSLRHTFCTRFCENETNLKVIQEIMGHASIITTMDIYNEATKEKKIESFVHLDGKIKIS